MFVLLIRIFPIERSRMTGIFTLDTFVLLKFVEVILPGAFKGFPTVFNTVGFLRKRFFSAS